MKKILVIEDNLTNMKLFRIILNANNYEIIEANDGQTGVDHARIYIPNLIIMDIQLPTINSKDATLILKKDPITQNIPIIAVTSFAIKGDRELCLQMGFSEYITKPINKNQLINIIKEILKD